MKILLTGGRGFVATYLTGRLLAEGHGVLAVDRVPGPEEPGHPRYEYIQADTTQPGAWQDRVGAVDGAINLAGATIFKRWNASYKKAIYNSRVLTTRNLVAAIGKNQGFVLASTSAAGYYGWCGDEVLEESDAPGDDFLARVCVDWEAEALRAGEKGARVCLARFGVVLGKNGGALAQMKPAYKLGAGGPLGHGNQYFPWIHMEDLFRAFVHLLEGDDLEGPFNFTAPGSVTNRELAKALGRALKRPAFLPAPAMALRLILGEFGETLLQGQRAVPKALTDSGFSFLFPTLDQALEDLLKHG